MRIIYENTNISTSLLLADFREAALFHELQKLILPLTFNV